MQITEWTLWKGEDSFTLSLLCFASKMNKEKYYIKTNEIQQMNIKNKCTFKNERRFARLKSSQKNAIFLHRIHQKSSLNWTHSNGNTLKWIDNNDQFVVVSIISKKTQSIRVLSDISWQINYSISNNKKKILH